MGEAREGGREVSGWLSVWEGTVGLTRRFNRRSAKASSAVGAQRVPLQKQPDGMDVSQLLPLLLLMLLLLLSGCLPKVSPLYMFGPWQKGSGFDSGLKIGVSSSVCVRVCVRVCVL